MRGHVVRMLVLSAALLVTGACAQAGRDGGGGAVSPPTGSDELVLRLSELPGLLPPGGAAALPPTFSLYGGGRLITTPAGAATVWPVLSERTVPTDQMTSLLGAAIDTGVLTGGPAGSGPGPDAPVVTLTLVSGAVKHTATLPRADAKVAALRTALSQQASGQGQPYQPAAVAVIAVPTGTPAAERTWPLGSLTGRTLTGLNAGAHCTVLRGADIETARTAAASATPGTTWSSDGQAWTIAFRPLLPDETDCPT